MPRKQYAEPPPLKADEEETFVTIPPDGGWGWVVVIAAFYAYFLTDGILYSFGVFLHDISLTFECTESQVSLANAINVLVFCSISCPVAAALINKYGYRWISIIGSVISAAGFVATSFCHNLYLLIVIYGVVCGMGFGMIFMGGVIAVGFYFERWRAVANGISVCGSGAGGLALPPVVTMLMDRFGWRHALRVLAGMFFLSFLCGLAYKPIRLTRVVVKKDPATVKHTGFFGFRATRVADKQISDIDLNSTYGGTAPKPCCHCCSCARGARPMYKDDIFYSSSVPQLPQFKHAKQDDMYKDAKKRNVAYELAVTRMEEEDAEDTSCCKCCPLPVKHGLGTMLDCKLFTSFTFHLLLSNAILMALGVYGPYLYIKDSAIQHKIDKQMAIWLLSSIGLANVVGRIIACGLSIIPGVQSIIICYIFLICGGVMTGMEPFSYNLYYQFTFCGIYGISSAVLPALRTIVVVETLGLSKLSGATGMMMCFQGIGTFLGTIISVQLNDSSGDFKLTFYFGGVCITLSGACLVVVHIYRKIKKIDSSNLD